MPQINRIRVNNVKYNFGTQSYDDFLMRFSCKNTIYDLANGGGKSVLMLLLLQNLIPNCTLDDKQPVEKLFRTNEGSTTIHSLIEWKLDNAYIKDNYKYMTTGFCARKAKDADDENKTTASIEYFNYCIFYREFGDNDIKNLPLSNGKEKITYQGLKNYLKDLEKKDFGVSVRIFERKNEYQKFLTKYGIFESQWEIVRGINKTEGHVRTYFESNYKTARKVVEDLLIEEIIEKSFTNRIGKEDDYDMAKTLLDIKDKIIELTKKKETIDNYDMQIQALNAFAGKIEDFIYIYSRKEELSEELIKNFLITCGAIKKKEAKIKEAEDRRVQLSEQAEVYTKELAVCNILEDEDSLKKQKEELSISEAELARLNNSMEGLDRDLKLKETAMYYDSYRMYLNKREEVKASIDNRMRDFEDIRSEMTTLAASMKLITDKKLSQYDNNRCQAASALKKKNERSDKELKQIKEYDKNIAVNTTLIDETRDEIKKLVERLTALMNNVSLLVADDIESMISTVMSDIRTEQRTVNELEKLLSDTINQRENVQTKIIENRLRLENTRAAVSEKQLENAALEGYNKKALELNEVYKTSGASELEKRLAAMIKSGMNEEGTVENEQCRLVHMKESYAQGVYSFDEPQYQRVKEYLTDTYKEDVVTGDVWLKSLPTATRRDILKRVPFVTHSIVVKEDFERIKSDITLRNICRGAYVIPVIGEGVLYETRNTITSDNILFVLKDMSFLSDEEETRNEIEKLEEEISAGQSSLARIKDRLEVLRADYAFVLEYVNSYAPRYEKNAHYLEENLRLEEELLNASATFADNLAAVDKRISSLKEDISSHSTKAEELNRLKKDYEDIREDGKRIAEKENYVKELQKKVRKDTTEYDGLQSANDELKKEIAQLEVQLTALDEKTALLSREWDQEYAPYYKAEQKGDEGLTEDAIRVKFGGLKAVINKEAADVTDKEKLFETYDAAVSKAESDLNYIGVTVEEAAKLYEENKLDFGDRTELYIIRDAKKALGIKKESVLSDITAKNTLINRTEGAIAHQIKTINEKYGSFTRPETDNVKVYQSEKQNMLKSVNEQIKLQAKEYKTLEDEYTKAVVTRKDIERIIKNAGITVPEKLSLTEDDYEVNEEEYEKVSAEFDRLIVREGKKKEEFLKDRAALKIRLEELLAFELAYEVSESMEVPRDTQAAKEMIENIKETNSCIELEKSRISSGLTDMQNIRDNFENRCIQTCMNIRAELERLPKLSKITLDDEVISIIGLGIPYVKEEYIKSRMSSYIQEIIAASESFKDGEERLKYIRSKLSWKKLFSVIVSDMNGIKLNLYKRERIKEQSRYLRYEEAVGSTGQSQGIYIQFLIAIINYISNINAGERANGILGKTIFIDNPFGAAKDVYIWEPIFKLLSTNHVQLIVPARGTTPAITGRFDVNYVLGQKLVDGRQQTVVVDYRSQTNDTELEYTKLTFTQNTFDFGE